MNDRSNEEESLLRLLGDLEELERTRGALLKRVEAVRSVLAAAGSRISTIRASAELLCDHISDSETAAEELSMLEREMRDVERDVEQLGREAAGMTFEADSLKDTLDEADQELERLSAILVERRGKPSRGH
jgi:predicted  nucleic acid-binding Zn-ribbon protein